MVVKGHSPLTTLRFMITFLSLKIPSMSTLQQYGPLSVRLTFRMSRSICPSKTSPVSRYRSATCITRVRVRSQGFACTDNGTLVWINSSTSEELCLSLYLGFHDLGDDTIFVRLHQDVVAPEGPAATTPADPTQTETLHRVLTGQRGHAALRHFKTGNRRKVSTCSTDAHLKHLY